MNLETKPRVVEKLRAVLVALGRQGTKIEDVFSRNLGEDLERLFDELAKVVFEDPGVSQRFDGFTFWSCLEWALAIDYPRWIERADTSAATDILSVVSHNLELEAGPKLLIIPLRKLRFEGQPLRVSNLYFLPAPKDEETFVSMLQAVGVGQVKLREGIFDHTSRKSGFSFPDRPLLLFYSETDDWTLERDFRLSFRARVLPLLQVFSLLFPEPNALPRGLELLSGRLTTSVVSSYAILELRTGDMGTHNINALGGEILVGCDFSTQIYDRFRSQEFERMLDWLNHSNGKLARKVSNSLSFFGRAWDSQLRGDNLSAFVFSIVAIEALFSRSKDTPLRYVIGDCVAFASESKQESREQVAQRMRQLYDRRSEILHSGIGDVNKDDLAESMSLAARCLYWVLNGARQWGDVPDQRLWTEIDRLKFA